MTAQDNSALQGDRMTVVLVAGAVVAAIAFAIASYNLATQGHAAFNMDAVVAWGLPISTYVFFALTSSGLTIVAALAMLFGFERFYPIVKRAIWLALITLIAGLAVLAVELPYLFRMIVAIPLNMQIESAFFWMGLFYLLDLLFMALKFRRMEQGDWDSKASYQLGLASFIAAMLAAGMLAMVFGMMDMRPFWSTGLLPAYFYATALLSGIAMLVLALHVSYGGRATPEMPAGVRQIMDSTLPKLFAAALGITLVLLLTRAMAGLYANTPGIHLVWTQYLLASPWYHFAIWAGLVLPFILLMQRSLRGRMGVQVIASLLVIAGMFIERLFFMVGGQVVPLFKGTWERGLAEYVPSFNEWLLAVMGFALLAALYALGEKWFSLAAASPEKAERVAPAAAAGEEATGA